MIVAATLPLLLEHGDRVTTRQIAEAAGHRRGHDLPGLRRQGRAHRRGDRGRARPRAARSGARATIPTDLAVRDERSRPRSSIIAAARHRHLAAGVERRHALPRDRRGARWPTATRSCACSTPHRDEITVEPIAAARLLRALTLVDDASDARRRAAVARRARAAVPARRRRTERAVLMRAAAVASRPVQEACCCSIVVLQTVQTSAALDAARRSTPASSTTACSPATRPTSTRGAR